MLCLFAAKNVEESEGNLYVFLFLVEDLFCLLKPCYEFWHGAVFSLVFMIHYRLISHFILIIYLLNNNNNIYCLYLFMYYVISIDSAGEILIFYTWRRTTCRGLLHLWTIAGTVFAWWSSFVSYCNFVCFCGETLSFWRLFPCLNLGYGN